MAQAWTPIHTPDNVLLDQVRAIGVTATRYTLFDGTDRPQPTNRMVSNDPFRDYMQRHDCSFPEAFEALIAQLAPPTARDVRRALQTLGLARAPADLLKVLEDRNADRVQEAA